VPAPFRYDRRFELSVAPATLWSALEQTDRYPDWWSWLHTLEGGGLRAGDTARCVVRAPLPYSLRFDVHVEEVVPMTRVVTRIDGDLVGPAHLEITTTDLGCEARLLWELELRDPVLRPLAIVTRPAMQWAHDRVVDVGFAEFQRRALDGHAST
jgi:uncharacterized protein YndB with AHSA1/START domain